MPKKIVKALQPERGTIAPAAVYHTTTEQSYLAQPRQRLASGCQSIMPVREVFQLSALLWSGVRLRKPCCPDRPSIVAP